MEKSQKFESWLRPEASGLYCVPGDFYIDPHQAVDRAIITHGHSDHARPGHRAALATPETLDIMKIRLGEGAPRTAQPATYGQNTRVGAVDVSLVPAGHILGSAQVVLQYGGQRAIVSGDYKRQADATCAAFEVVQCDVFVTEATFGLPVFKHPSAAQEVAKLLASLQAFPERTHQVGVYGLGKCQRVIQLLRAAGYEKPIWIHGALRTMCDYYRSQGIELGEVLPVADATTDLEGEIVLSPPSALGDRWSRRFADPLPCLASGWMGVRARARQRGVELPLIISDHADWPELLQTVGDTQASEIWVTHGREEALVYAAQNLGLTAKALSIVGREDDGE